MTHPLRKTMVTTVATAIAAAGLFTTTSTSTANALPPGTPKAGSVNIVPATGDSSTSMSVMPPDPSYCPGDSATNGYRWNAFMAAESVDPGTLTYDNIGPITPAGGGFVAPLYDFGGNAQTTMMTSINTGMLTGFSQTTLQWFPPAPDVNSVPPGVYNFGVSCTKFDGTATSTEKYWATKVTITADPTGGPAQIRYAVGAVAAAPVLNSVTGGDKSISGTFTPGASDPAATGFTATATPVGGGTAVTASLAADATTFTITGLTNGTSYDVKMTATNSVGTSADSNVISAVQAALPGQPAVTGLAATVGSGQVTLSWNAPAGVVPTGYDLVATPTPPATGTPLTASIAAPATSYTFTGLTAGTSYDFTVTATYPAPDFGTPATVSATVVDMLLIQDVTVERPAGRLVLTQRCGVYGALAEEPASPGFGVLPAKAAAAGTGTAPTSLANGAGTPDPQFGNYPTPDPEMYPTHCSINFGTASLVRSGPLKGAYYAADSQINQVTVADLRDTDSGWTVTGTMSSFVNGTKSFSGNALGWSPVVSETSTGQTVVAGPTVLPNAASGGLAGGAVLGTAATGQGLGIASIDARLKVLVPTSVPRGVYAGTLTLTVI